MMKRFYFNMIEIILAISIIAIGISSIMVLFTSGLRTGNDAVQLNNVPDATESILAHIRQTVAFYGLETGWSSNISTTFPNLPGNGWSAVTGVNISAFGNNLDTDGRSVVSANGGSNLLYRQLVVTAVDSSGAPTHYASTFSAIAEARRVVTLPAIVLSHPHTPLGEHLPTSGTGSVNLSDTEGANADANCRLVLEVRISYPADAAPEARESKIHRIEIFNDKYNRFLP